jgi:hypothetical protein
MIDKLFESQMRKVADDFMDLQQGEYSRADVATAVWEAACGFDADSMLATAAKAVADNAIDARIERGRASGGTTPPW